ncbi:MAG: non-ribosomal peptide synthetase [Pseudomonadales bacterium]|nr:non-ribosomal peptide synthetase [Pseudomonadales bacterium]
MLIKGLDSRLCGNDKPYKVVMEHAHLLSTIEAQLYRYAERTAIDFDNTHISHGQVLDKFSALAERLAALDLRPQAHVGVFMERSPEVLLCLLALWKIGAVYIPLDPDLPLARLRFICEDADLDLILTQVALQEKISSLCIRQVALYPVDFAIDDSRTRLREPSRACLDLNNTAYILYTSGTTGIPKGVEIQHRGLAFVLHAILDLLDITEQEIIAGIASFSFDISFFELLLPLMTGARLVLFSQSGHKDPQVLAAAIEDKKISLIQATPTLWQLLIRHDWNPAHRALKAIATGEALPFKLAADITVRNTRLWNLYGPTECTIWATAREVTPAVAASHDSSCVSIGRALATCELHVLKASGQEAAADEKGELCIGGPALALGYYGKPALTQEKFINLASSASPAQKVYKTGDLCSRNHAGELFFHGRIDNQVKLNGYRIEPEEIEQQLEQHPSIAQAIVKPIRIGSSRLEILAAWVCPRKGSPNKSAGSLNAFLQGSLPAYMLPERYFFIEHMPMSATGKKDRQALFAPPVLRRQQQISAGEEDDVAILASLVCEILDLPEIGSQDSFFDVGGNSMLAATLLLAVNTRFGTAISLREMLSTPPTLDSISRMLGKLQANSEQVLYHRSGEGRTPGHL